MKCPDYILSADEACLRLVSIRILPSATGSLLVDGPDGSYYKASIKSVHVQRSHTMTGLG